ncbi:DNA polymerase III subunit gamma/tau [Candidatus Omnitrophota bacterium]
MTYLPFARKHRPQDFDEVVGQEHITTTLKNAISLNRVHHAYLFAGPRGIGKTSTARILSKALNCEKGASPKPCNKCVSCRETNIGSNMDVIEIDGASNRGIDEIRNLREAVKFAASKSPYKIYIIDEVHMLTTPAFNALLKTLEEPPKHVKFIFATTEPHSLPATILSRCQRFDFRRISLKDIILKLKEVAKEEKLDIEVGVFLYIAKASDGSMRDAESILDQVASFSNGKVHLKDVTKSLGMIEEQNLFKCADLIINRDTKSAIHLVNELLDSGKDAKQFLFEMLEHFRNIMVVKVGAASEELIDCSKDSIALLMKQAQSFSHGDIFYIINTISNALKTMKQLLPERIVLELCMVRLTCRDSISSIEDIISKLPEVPESHCEAPRQSISLKPIIKKNDESQKAVIKHEAPQKSVSSGTNVSVDISRAKDAWPILIKTMAVKRMSISSYLSEGDPESAKGNTILVAFPRELNFHREVLEEKNNKDSIEAQLSQIMDTPVKLQFIATDKKIKEANSVEDALLTKEELKKREPIIGAALNIFGGKILRARNT